MNLQNMRLRHAYIYPISVDIVSLDEKFEVITQPRKPGSAEVESLACEVDNCTVHTQQCSGLTVIELEVIRIQGMFKNFETSES